LVPEGAIVVILCLRGAGSALGTHFWGSFWLAWFRGPPPAARASSSRTDRVATCAAPAGWCQKALLWFSCVCAGLALLWVRISGCCFWLAWFRGPPPAARASSSRTDRVATCATPASWCLHAIQTRMAAYHSVAVSAAVLVTAFEC